MLKQKPAQGAPAAGETRSSPQNPFSGFFSGLLESRRLKIALRAAERLNLGEDDLIIVKGGFAGAKVLVIPGDAQRQLEELGRMSLRLGNGAAWELFSPAVGESAAKDVRVAKSFILPEEDRILALRKGFLGCLPNGLTVPAGNGFRKTGWLAGMGTHEFFLEVDASNAWGEPALRDTFEWACTQLAKPATVEELMGGRWEMLAAASSVSPLKEFESRVKKAGSTVCGLHIHPEENGRRHKITTWDVISEATGGKGGWIAVMHVPDGIRPEDFKFSKERLSVFHLPKGRKWEDKAYWDGISYSLKELEAVLEKRDDGQLNRLPQFGLSEFEEFERKQGGVIWTCRELRAKAGKRKQA